MSRSQGDFPDGWTPEEKITVEEALRAYTASAAYAEFAEEIKGTITVGKLADMVVLSRNLLDIPPDTIPGTAIWKTIVGGRTVYDKNQ